MRLARAGQSSGAMPAVRRSGCGSPIRFIRATVNWWRFSGDNAMAELSIS
jgi:hypothetical protein